MATSPKIIKRFEEIAQLMRRRAGRKGTRLALVAQRLADTFPHGQIFKMLDVVGDHLGRETDRLILSIGRHTKVQASVENLNRGYAAWLTAFFGPIQDNVRKLEDDLDLILEIEQQATGFLLDSHHLVEERHLRHYKRDLMAYAPPNSNEPSPNRMITIAIPLGTHRGNRWEPLEQRSVRLRELRKALPKQPYNLTHGLETRFDNVYLNTPGNTFPQFLSDLSEFYLENTKEWYAEVDLPGGAKGGIRAGLLKIAADTGQDEDLIVRP